MEGQMFRLGTLGFASLLATTATAWAQTPVERGDYLVNSILACGNCHTPKTASGEPIAEKELSGGLVFTTPAFDAAASNITVSAQKCRFEDDLKSNIQCFVPQSRPSVKVPSSNPARLACILA
jgi:hypothetical protein